MNNRNIMYIVLTLLIVSFGCSRGYIPGTGGKNAAQRSENTGHPPIPAGVRCYVCHKREVPPHQFHSTMGRDCATCHVKTIWLALNYPHDKWPLNEKHRTRCTFCHQNASAFDFTYQCWGCHHKQDETKQKHAARNNHDIAKCSSCHKASGTKPAAN
ncbi:cytochrome c3 family protein [Candidatus Latescibacterota bacterium]